MSPATNFKLKIYASNSKGKSDSTWLKAQTLRPAERLIDNNSNSKDGHAGVILLRGKPMVMALLIGAAVVTLIVIALGVIAVLRVRRSGSNGNNLPQQDAPDQQQPASTLFEEDEECCCDDDCCDEMLLTSTASNVAQQQQLQQNSNSNKGPPDIIPSFGYCGGLDNKNFISYGKKNVKLIKYWAHLRPHAFTSHHTSRRPHKSAQ